MQMATTRNNEIIIDTDATQTLLDKKASPNKRNKWLMITFILTVIISSLISSLVTYFIVSSDNNETNVGGIPNYDIAIIGAGSTGLIQAHLLSQQHPDWKIIVLERLSRFGGRQWTSFIHKIDENNNIINSIHFENGAMRFRSYHTLQLRLLSYLNLCDDIIPISVHSNISSQQIFQYRNKRITQHELFGINRSVTANYFSSVFNVNNNEIPYLDGSPETIWRTIYDKILSENNNGNEPVSETDWFEFRNNYTFNGEYLYNYGESIALRVIGNYSREILNYRYRSTQEQIQFPYSRNVAMLLYEMFNKLQYTANHTNKTNQWTLKNGYGSMNDVLYKSLMTNQNVDILFNNKVSSINSRSKHKYLIESNSGEIKHYYSANKIILSIPPDKTLQLLPYSAILNTMKFKNMLESFVWGDDMKINLIYDSSFWIDENLQALMPSDTDFEIRQFYFENAWTNGTLTALHIYASGKNMAFWYGAQLIGDKYPIHESLVINNNNDTLNTHIASIVVVEEVVNQMRQLTQKYVPMPLAAFINFLGQNMESSGVTRFKATTNADNVINQSYQPIENENIFMAVSDFAWQYGWMESSISAATNNLQRNFNLQNPLNDQPICTLPSI
eukprot:192372_1